MSARGTLCAPTPLTCPVRTPSRLVHEDKFGVKPTESIELSPEALAALEDAYHAGLERELQAQDFEPTTAAQHQRLDGRARRVFAAGRQQHRHVSARALRFLRVRRRSPSTGRRRRRPGFSPRAVSRRRRSTSTSGDDGDGGDSVGDHEERVLQKIGNKSKKELSPSAPPARVLGDELQKGARGEQPAPLP